ncbi:unnamed protein product [Hydatigera taeniaeformis]|uniref:Uncharacterized protein n=1 Tax=Hydatigena taeniaeformis TaxID=6205 RepID=A0A3P7GYM1_HYDTA|nr:unnamed protein product [Hydatigera taeniaeformis]
MDEELAKVFKATLLEVTSSKPSDVKDTKVWATALVVAYLRVHLSSRKEEWEMVVRKAVEWLEGSGVNAEAVIEKARVALEKLLPRA